MRYGEPVCGANLRPTVVASRGVLMRECAIVVAIVGVSVARAGLAQPVDLVGKWSTVIVDSPDEAGSPVMCEKDTYAFSKGGKGKYTAKCLDMPHEEEFRVNKPFRWEWRGTAFIITWDQYNRENCDALPEKLPLKASAVAGCKYFVESPTSVLVWRTESGPIRRQLLRLTKQSKQGKSK